MKKKLLFISVFISSMLFSGLIKAQTYHEDDKAGLRAILRQEIPFGVALHFNLEYAGLTVADTAQWLQDESWIAKITTHNGRATCVWNNDSPKRLVDLSFENTTQRKMYGTVDASYFTKLERLNISGNDFVELKGFSENLKELFCYDNRISEIDLHGCPYLEIFDCRNNQIKSLNLESYELQYIDCSKNQITHITSPLMGEYIVELMFADVSENNLTFSSLPNWSLIASYAYAPQNPIQGGSIRANEEIDLWMYGGAFGVPVVYNWYKENGTLANVISDGGGRFMPGDEFAGEKLICHITNQYYPQLTLEYHVNVTEPVYFIYDEGDKEGLRAFMRQEGVHWSAIFYGFGLTPSDTLSWYESEEWIEKITPRYCSWNEDTPKRLTGLFINTTPWGHDPIFGGCILDCTPFEKLDSLQCDNNWLADIILTGNRELRSLNCALSECLTTLDLTQNVNLEYLNFSNCYKLDSLDLSHNIHLKDLMLENNYWQNDKISTLDLTHNTELRILNLAGNNLTEIDLSQNINLQALNLSTNNFKFSTLPLPSTFAYEYSPQREIQGGNIPANWIIDLSSEYDINGSITTYEWHEIVGGPALSLYDLGGGKFIAGTEHEGKWLVCHMRNNLFPELQLNYYVTISHALPELLTDHLTLVESPQTDYYVASSGQTFKVKANASVDPALVKIGLFKTTGSFVEEISFERENDIYTCRISNATASGSYMIQAYTGMGGNITILKRPENSHLVDILPFAFTKIGSYSADNLSVMSHLVLNTSEKNLYKAYIDNTFRVVVNIPTITAETRIGLFDLYGELVEDITQSVSGKIFTCMVSYNVFPDNYLIMPYTDTPQGPEIIERSPGAAIMDRLPIAVDYNWGFRSAELIENRNDETGISLLSPVSISLAQNVLYVNAQEEVKTIEIFDINGRLVKKVQSVTNVSVAELPAGIYIAKINTLSETVTTKIKKN